jgi:hypothetical protein
VELGRGDDAPLPALGSQGLPVEAAEEHEASCRGTQA